LQSATINVHVPGKCQTACDDRLKAGSLRGDPASPRVSEGTGGAWMEWTQDLLSCSVPFNILNHIERKRINYDPYLGGAA
jgi:hypothetical protein